VSCRILDFKWKRVCYGSASHLTVIAIFYDGGYSVAPVISEWSGCGEIIFRVWWERSSTATLRLKKENEID